MRVDADHLGRHRLALGRRDGHFRGVIDDMVIGDDVAVGRNEESGALRLREMMPRRVVAPVGAVVVVRHAEVTEEMVERAVLGNIRHSRHPLRIVVIDLVGVAELDLDRNDGGLHAVDDIGERGRPGRGLRGRRLRRKRARPRFRTRRRRGPPARQRPEAPHGGNRRVRQTTSSAPSVSIGAAETIPAASHMERMRSVA